MIFFVLLNTKEDILKNVGNRAVLGHQAQKLPLFLFSYYGGHWCPKTAEQRHSYRFGTTWKWVNYDRICISGWTIPLTPLYCRGAKVDPFLWPLYISVFNIASQSNESKVVYKQIAFVGVVPEIPKITSWTYDLIRFLSFVSLQIQSLVFASFVLDSSK